MKKNILVQNYKVEKARTNEKKFLFFLSVESLVRVMEEKLLGFRKVLLLGKTDADLSIAKLCDSVQDKFFADQNDFVSSGNKQLLHKILDGHEYLSEDQLFKALNYFNDKSEFHSYVKDVLQQVRSCNFCLN